jgi:DNA-binding MarR family transcriptional regulator
MFRMDHVRCTLPPMDGLLPSLEAIVAGSVAVTARALAGTGSELTLVQWRALVVLHDSSDPVAIGELARALGASPSATSRLVRRLLARGYVAREHDRGDRRDRRERRIVVSARGRRLVRRIIGVRDRELAALAIVPDDAPAIARLGVAFAGAGQPAGADDTRAPGAGDHTTAGSDAPGA